MAEGMANACECARECVGVCVMCVRNYKYTSAQVQQVFVISGTDVNAVPTYIFY